MKVIDLLNKIANGEEIPKQIMIKNEKYFFAEEKEIEGIDSIYRYKSPKGINWVDHEDIKLDDEVIEENKKIEKLDKYEICEQTRTQDIAKILLDFGVKINEIIDKLNTKEE